MPAGHVQLRSRKGQKSGGKNRIEVPPTHTKVKQPIAPPPFGVKEIREAIPKHCFERSMVRSFMHLFSDIIKASILAYAATYIHHPALPVWAPYVLWPVYWVLQGLVWTGLWVMAHEAGHQAFSDSKTVNDAVGLIVHSFLLVPYHSWRISHSNHHKNTCSMENDEVHLPPVRSVVEDMLDESPIVNFLQIVAMLTVGWPMYLFFNSTGPAKYQGKSRSHFNPYSALFQPKDRAGVILSILVLACMVYALVVFTQTFGVAAFLCYYFVPYLIVNYHLVLITFLQHTDEYIPHFRSEEFTWLRGAMATVDRSFGWLVDHQIHRIADTHVAHHLFSQMPFYHAEEATKHLKKVLGPYYLSDDTPIWPALWRAWNKCRFVEDDGQIVFGKKNLEHRPVYQE